MRDLPTTFSLPQRLLHWAMVFFLLLNLLLPYRMWSANLSLGPGAGVPVHIVIGTAIPVLAAIRLAWRLICGVPPEPLGVPRFFRILARSGQWVFYALFFAMPLTGVLAYVYGQPVALTLHTQVLQPLFWALIAVHVSLALAHQYLWKTDMLGKIIRG